MAAAKKDVWKGPESPPYKVINYDKEIQDREKMVVFLSKKLEKANATGAAAKSDEIEINGKLFKKSYVKDKLHILNYDIEELRINIRKYDATLDFSEINKITNVNKLREILQNAHRHRESYSSSIEVLKKNVNILEEKKRAQFKGRIKFVLSRPVRQMEHADFWLEVDDEMNTKKGGKRKTRRKKRRKKRKKRKSRKKKRKGGMRKKGLSRNKYKRSYQKEQLRRIQQAHQQQAQENKMSIMPGTGSTPTIPKNKPSGTGGTGGRKTRRKYK
jgi:hypothetical protein